MKPTQRQNSEFNFFYFNYTPAFMKLWKVEPRSHFISRLSVIVRTKSWTEPLLTVTNVSTTCAVTFRVKVSCIMSVDGIRFWLCIDLIGQLRCDVSQLSPVVIGYEDSKSHGAFSIVRD